MITVVTPEGESCLFMVNPKGSVVEVIEGDFTRVYKGNLTEIVTGDHFMQVGGRKVDLARGYHAVCGSEVHVNPREFSGITNQLPETLKGKAINAPTSGACQCRHD